MFIRTEPQKIERIFYLGGDTYPGDAHIEEAITRPLKLLFNVPVTLQSDLLSDIPPDTNWKLIKSRVAQLHTLAGDSDKSGLVMIGRSSGARVATLFASDIRIAAVICLGYPFQHPQRGAEAGRIAHLADIQTPTLIIQGIDDEYGGIEIARQCPYSPFVEIEFVEANHAMRLSAEGWTGVASKVAQFIERHTGDRTAG